MILADKNYLQKICQNIMKDKLTCEIEYSMTKNLTKIAQIGMGSTYLGKK